MDYRSMLMDFPTPTFWDQWGEAITIVIVATLLAFAIRQLAAFQGAKLASRGAGAGGAGYRQLAEEMTVALRESEKGRQADATAFADVRQRLGAIEALLRQVD